MNFKDFYPEFTGGIRKDSLPGGVADDAVADYTDVKELSIGVQIEMEHTNDPDIATEIALDHIRETPDYYSKLVAAGLASEFKPSANSGLGDPNSSVNDVSRLGKETTCTPGNDVVGTIGNTSDGKVSGRRSIPVLNKGSVPMEENKSETTYDQYRDIARRLIAHLMKMSQVNPKNYSEAQRNITPSLVKSVLIGLGDSDPELSSVLTKVGSVAHKPKMVKRKF